MTHNKRITRHAGRYLINRIWIFAAALFFLWLYPGKTTVKAEPASLESESAVIYEQTNEESTVVGNLVRGSSFELLGSVTAEDGSTWYHVSAFGIQGYIRGNAEIGEGSAVQEPETPAAGEENPEPEDVVQPEEGNLGAEGAAGAEIGNAGAGEAAGAETENREPDAEEAEESEEEEPESESSEEQPAIYQGSNTREKTYAVGNGNLRTAGQEEQMEENGSARQEKEISGAGKRINKTFIFFVLVLVFSALTSVVTFGKLKEEINRNKGIEEKQSEPLKPLKGKRAVHKKKKHRKKKGKAKRNGNIKK